VATYAVGDIQGCHAALLSLVEAIRFDPARDRLWFVGDLVNRGPDSLATLRFVRGLGESAVTVLGNHDLHLLAVAEGHARLHRGDTLEAILGAPDRDELLDWVRHLPMIHFEDGYLLVHAGLLPQWTARRALELGAEVERALRGPGYGQFIRHMYGNQPAVWNESLAG